MPQALTNSAAPKDPGLFSFPPYRDASPQCRLFLTSPADNFRDCPRQAAGYTPHGQEQSPATLAPNLHRRRFPASRQSPATLLIGCRQNAARASEAGPSFTVNQAGRYTTNKRAPGLSATVRLGPQVRLHPGPPRKDARWRRDRLSPASPAAKPGGRCSLCSSLLYSHALFSFSLPFLSVARTHFHYPNGLDFQRATT